jgi:hypothetical protein
MDRDKRWDRVKIAVDGLVQGKGDKVDDEKDLIKTIEKGYEGDITDEFIKPIICGSEGSRIQSRCNTLFKVERLTIRGRHSIHVQLPIRPNARDHLRPRYARQAHGGRGPREPTHYHHDSIQWRIPIPRRFPSRIHDQRPCRMAR